MQEWTKRKRLETVLKGELADRPPVSAWRHFTEVENDPIALADKMLEFQAQYDWDFIKVNSRAVYYHEPWGNRYDNTQYTDVKPLLLEKAINSVEDLAKIDVKPGDYESFGEQIVCAERIMKGRTEDVPVLYTLFTPIGILLNLCGERSIGRYRESPRDESYMFTLLEENRPLVHQALQNITDTFTDYVAKLMDTGIDGLFYAGLGMAREGFFTMEEWEELVKPYDLQILESIKDKITLFHTCGIYGNPERFVDFPISALHWAPSATGNPPLKGSGEWLKGMIAMGGVDERLFGQDKAEEIGKLAAKAIEENRDQPFILAPDCSVSIRTLDSELKAFRDSVR